MAEHLIQRAFDPLYIERKQPQHDKAEVADGRVGNQLFHIRLHQGHQRSIHDTNH